MSTSPIHHPQRNLAGVACALALAGTGLVACSSGIDPTRVAAAPADAHMDVHAGAQPAAHAADQQVALYSTMRSLWAQHMEWTYATVVAFADDSPALQPTIDRLLRNQSDIGSAVATYYGAPAGDQLTGLLVDHIKGAVPVLAAAKTGDEAALGRAVTAWYANAQAIADFLATANPAWKKADLRQMMKGHITQTIAYASEVLGGNFEAAIRDYDEAELHMQDMADLLSHGIAEQFPDRF